MFFLIVANRLATKKGLGPGGGNSHCGGGYGGQGGSYGAASGGATYGSEEVPLQPGSAGGNWNTNAGGNGGGLIWLEVKHRLNLNGTLRANGSAATSTANAGGSGGGIYIKTRLFSGNGALSVKGGNAPGGGSGGGGRIAIWRVRDDPAPSEVTLDVANGIWGGNEKGANGEPGSVFWGYLPQEGTVLVIR